MKSFTVARSGASTPLARQLSPTVATSGGGRLLCASRLASHRDSIRGFCVSTKLTLGRAKRPPLTTHSGPTPRFGLLVGECEGENQSSYAWCVLKCPKRSCGAARGVPRLSPTWSPAIVQIESCEAFFLSSYPLSIP